MAGGSSRGPFSSLNASVASAGASEKGSRAVSASDRSELDGQWVRWYQERRSAHTKEVFRVEGMQVFRPGAEAPEILEAQTPQSYCLKRPKGTEAEISLEVNDWGMLTMSDGTRWVRTGPEALLEGKLTNELRTWTRIDRFTDTTGEITFKRAEVIQKKMLRGSWKEDYHVFQLEPPVRVSILENTFRLLELRFRIGACTIVVAYDHSISPVPWTLYPVAEMMDTHFSQTFTGECVGGEAVGWPRTCHCGWWWAKLRCKNFVPPTEGHVCVADTRDHPRFSCHKGPGHLVAHHDPDARNAARQSDENHSSYFLGDDMVQVQGITLAVHACTKSFRGPRCLEMMDATGRCYSEAAKRDCYEDGLNALKSPLELHVQVWPEVDKAAMAVDDEPTASGYMQLNCVPQRPPEEDALQYTRRLHQQQSKTQ